MKQQDITYQDKLNELRLDISHPNSKGFAFLLVEGKTDIRLFRKIFDLSHCKVESIPGGNAKVEECVYELARPNIFVLAIRDADFINLILPVTYPRDGIHVTDLHDIEMMMVFEDEVIKSIFAEYLGTPESDNVLVRTSILKSVEMIGYLKWLNDEEDLRLKFECGFRDLISFQSGSFDFGMYLKRVLSKSPNAVINDEVVIIDKINRLKLRNPDLSQLVNGHDFISALNKYINEFGITRSLNDETLSGAFRIAYNFEFFAKTLLYSQIMSWSTANNLQLFAKQV